MASKKVLLVDDSATVLLMERLMLKECGCDVVTAVNGKEAVEKALREKPQLILLDVIMPVMNGFEACRELRRHDETRETPVLMVTTRGEPHNVEQGYECGCTEYLTKPFDRIELLSKLRNYLGE